MDIQNILSAVIDWFMENKGNFITAGAIIIGAIIVNRLAKSFIEKGVRKVIRGGDPIAEKKREDTLIAVFSGTVRLVVWVMAVMLALPKLGVDAAPIMGVAALLGFAIGFGAQTMVRDFLAGLFIILENQYRVGDIVDLGGTSGTVEDINLRRTVLRDFNGVQIFIPNGEITKSSNLTKGFAKVNFAVSVAYKEDIFFF